MRIDARAFRGMLEVLQVFSATGQLIQGSNFCRLETGDGCVIATLPTPAGWVRVQLQAEVTEADPSVLGVDLLLFRRTLRGVVWPKSGSAGDVELIHAEGKALTVRVPMWAKGRSEWVERPPKDFVYPPTEMVFWPEGALPLCKVPSDAAGSPPITTTADVWERVIDSVERSTASGQEKPNLRNIQVTFRSDEVLAVATDGGQAALCSETTVQPIEAELSVTLPALSVRTVKKVLAKVKAASDPLQLSVQKVDGRELLVLRMESAPIEMALALPPGGPPSATLEKLPLTTASLVGTITEPSRFIADLGLAAWNPDAKVVWIVVSGSELTIRSHSPLLDTRFLQPLQQEGPSLEMAIDQPRVAKAADQLKGLAEGGSLRLFVDDPGRPRRLLIRTIEDGGDRVKQVVLMATVTKGYVDFRAKVAKLADTESLRRKLRSGSEDLEEAATVSNG